MNTKNLFLIGGGEIKDGETEIIDSAFVQSVKEKKNFVFLPTASGDAEGYIATVKEVFAPHFDNFSVIKKDYSREQIVEILSSASAMYIGGGKTELIYELFEEKNLLPILKERIEAGLYVAGISSGVQVLSSHYIDFINNEPVWSKGWGFVNIASLVHADEEKTEKAFDSFKKNFDKKDLDFIAIGNKACIVLEDKQIKKYGDGFVWQGGYEDTQIKTI